MVRSRATFRLGLEVGLESGLGLGRFFGTDKHFRFRKTVFPTPLRVPCTVQTIRFKIMCMVKEKGRKIEIHESAPLRLLSSLLSLIISES